MLLLNKRQQEIDRKDFFYPSSCHLLHNKVDLTNQFGVATVYGVSLGSTKINYQDSSLKVAGGSYFSLNLSMQIKKFTIEAEAGVVIFIRYGYLGLNQLGLNSENTGRLTYIDGCTSTTLISPPRYGDPSLNLLSFPAGTEQSFHRHPSLRFGVVLEGSGFADTEKSPVRISKNSVFSISENELHRFRTTDKSMRVIAFHPDSDFGPKDNDHVMLNRTYLLQKP